MAILPELLIAAPVLQDFLIDKNALPMAGGTITCYQDNSRTTLKNWYYQTGAYPAYNYLPLPNPLTLSAAGTICDINGVDTIPFYYPYEENEINPDRQAYYITIVDYTQTNQITRQNFPYNTGDGGPNPPSNNTSVDNYIVNNVFWHNIGTATLSGVTATTPMVVAPSQHDNFQYPDIQFFKSTSGATDTVTFVKFTATAEPTLIGDITPEFYLNHVCSGAGAETYKYYLFPISLHLLSLSNTIQAFTATLQAMSSSSSTISLAIIQDPGTTGTLITNYLEPYTLSPTWTKLYLSGKLPSNVLINPTAAGNDAIYLQVGLPAAATCNISFTKPSFYLTEQANVPTNNFATYDQIDSVINSPRTGDIRTSLNPWYYWGWVPMNDGTIALNNTNSTPNVTRANVDCWALYNLIWTLAQPYDTGSTFNAIAQLYTNSVTPTATNYGMSAYADWTAGNQLALTKSLGRVIAGTVPLSALTGINYWIKPVTITSSSGILCTVTATTNMFTGQPIAFTYATAPGNIVANAIYYATNITSTTFQVAATYANALAGTPVIAYSSAGTTVLVDLNVTGAFTGQNMHTQLAAEVGAHVHPPGAGTAFVNTAASGSGFNGDSPLTSSLTTGLNTGGTPFNIVQPTTFYNIYIKL